MQIITGTKREVTVMTWQEQLEKHIKRANDSMECFRRFKDADDLTHLIEDCQKIIEYAEGCKKAIEHMDSLGM